MRNFSMKKFGTPIGAGPGSASEKVGSAAVGAPSGLCLAPFLPTSAAPVAALTAPATSSLEPLTFSLALCLASPVAFLAASSGLAAAAVGAVGAAAGAGYCGAGWSPLGVVSVVVVAGGTSETETMGGVIPGIVIWSIGVPGGTSTVTVTVWRPRRVTTSVRCSADA